MRENAPDARLIVDANEGWTVEHLKRFGDAFADLRVELIEQPLPAGEDDALFGVECPVPLGGRRVRAMTGGRWTSFAASIRW